MKIVSILLAAGQGTRMRSDLPKVLHPLLGRPLIHYSLEAVEKASNEKPVVVIGHHADEIRAALGDRARYVLQEEQLGTAHAVRQAEGLLRGSCDLVIVTYADMPLLRAETLQSLVQAHLAHNGPVTSTTVVQNDPRGFGRVVRGEDGRVLAVVEEAQATPEQLQIRELNVGAYCFDADWLWDALPKVPLSPKGEYYLTDLVAVAVAEGVSVQACEIEDINETIGINNRVHLAEAEAELRRRINRHWMLEGVTLIDPSATYIEPGVTIGQDTVIYPNTYLQGESEIGDHCTIGPNTLIRDTRVGSRCRVLASVLEGALLEDEVEIGPFGHLRNGAHLARGVHMGNFGEVKNSYLGPGTKMGHFSYVGDATIGPDVNIGAGTITCNFDGKKKNRTEIGEGAFIGSDTMLVAPVKIGAGARTGAGSVVTRDVEPDTLAVGVPARKIRRLEKGD